MIPQWQVTLNDMGKIDHTYFSWWTVHQYKRFLQELTQVIVIIILEELGQIEEFGHEFLDVSHVMFGGREPTLLDTVEHAVSDVEMATLEENKSFD